MLRSESVPAQLVNSRFCRLSALIGLFLVLVCSLAFADKKVGGLSKSYREWLDKDVLYIITSDEKKAFVELKTSEEREKFVERFWEVRNPTPGAPTNTYKEEHYRRLEYASQYFSTGRQRDGWATDRGRIYITLGPPQQRANYVTQSEVRGMEIWFYSNSHPALPPFFYVVFYEKDFGEFRLYSPYMDGPQKLVTSYRAENGRVAAVKEIDRVLGREVARTTLSLIPGEPVSLNDAVSSLQSDVMLSTIKNLANHPFTVDALNLRRELSENVSHRVVMPGELLKVLTLPLRDAQGDIKLHYVLRLSHPGDFGVEQSQDRYYYSIEVSIRVLTPAGKLIFEQARKVSRYVQADEMERVKGKPFGYEGWLPLAPGKYRLEFIMTNLLMKTAFTAEREVLVPEPSDGLTVTDAVAFSQATAVPSSQAAVLPFTSGGVEFTPFVDRELDLLPSQDLKLFYQIWAPTTSPQDGAGRKLQVNYAYGQPGATGSAKIIREEVQREQFDPGGSLINGKKISTADLAPGNYRVAITITDPDNGEKRFSNFSFRVVAEQPSASEFWDIYADGLGDYVSSGQSDYERGLTYLAAGSAPKAAEWFRRAVQKNPSNEKARSRLADFYFSQRDFAKVAELYSHAGVTSDTADETVLNVAESLDKTGNTRKAADLVESALAIKPASGPLYLALASYYQRLGNPGKAEEFERRGRSIIAAPEQRP
jgi:GWxTD domain-containing protein